MWQRKGLFLLVFSIIIAEKHTEIAAFGWHIHGQSNEQAGDVKARPFLLDSLTSVAKNGASVWSNHIATESEPKRSTALEQMSPMYVSQLYRQMRYSRQDQKLDIDSVATNNEDTTIEGSYHRQTSHWPEHFFEEIIAFVAGGAAATSAFSAVVAGTIFATVVVTVGAIVNVMVFGDEIDVNYQLSNDGHRVEDYTAYSTDKYCDLDDAFFRESSTYRDGTDENVFDESTMQELKKCFAGKPSTKAVFFGEPISANTCSRHLPQYDISGFGIETYVNQDDVVPSEECDEYTVHEKKQEEVEPPKLIELIWHDSFSTAANSYYTTKMNANKRRRNKSNRKVAISSDQSFDLEETEREGAILLSDTFRLTSAAFGLLADAVRFAGESTAATAGGTARLVGGAVKASGWAVGSLGSVISADRSIEKGGSVGEHTGKKRHRTRQVAGASVKLLGDAIDNVAESVFLAGSATERVAFAAAGAAEGAVRLVEDFASSLSSAFAREGHTRNLSKKPTSVPIEPIQDKAIQVSSVSEQVQESYSADSEDDLSQALNQNDGDILAEDFIDDLTKHLFSLSSWTSHNAEYIMQDVAGVSSNAPQILFVLILLYIASVLLLSSGGRSKQSSREVENNAYTEKIPDRIESSNRKTIPYAAGEEDTHSALTIDSTIKRDPDTHFAHMGTGAVHYLICVAVLPMKILWVTSVRAYRFVLSRKFALLVLYLFCWLFICQMSQSRSAAIERKATLAGYRDAVESAGSSLGIDRLESAFWLNSIISRIWRVDSSEHLKTGIGGLEPLLSSAVSSILVGKIEDSYSRPTGVAHVSLASLTFGKSPPIVRDIEIKDVNTEEAAVRLGLDVIMLLEDAALMLDIKPSSLEYKMVPSTKVAITSLDLQMSLDVAVQATSEYPYISFVNISLSGVPEFSLRIIPQQESGLKGIDFGSFPLISKWVKEVINSSIVDYITPRYVSINVPAWLMPVGDDEHVVNYY